MHFVCENFDPVCFDTDCGIVVAPGGGGGYIGGGEPEVVRGPRREKTDYQRLIAEVRERTRRRIEQAEAPPEKRESEEVVRIPPIIGSDASTERTRVAKATEEIKREAAAKVAKARDDEIAELMQLAIKAAEDDDEEALTFILMEIV